MKRLVPVIVIALLLAGCGSLKFWGDDDDGKARAEPAAAWDEAGAAAWTMLADRAARRMRKRTKTRTNCRIYRTSRPR